MCVSVFGSFMIFFPPVSISYCLCTLLSSSLWEGRYYIRREVIKSKVKRPNDFIEMTKEVYDSKIITSLIPGNNYKMLKPFSVGIVIFVICYFTTFP